MLHYDNRLGMGDTGPYPLADGSFALVRDHFLNEENYPWAAGVSDEMPYVVTEVMVFNDPAVHIKINDIGTTFATPSTYLDSLSRVAVYARDTPDTPMSQLRLVGAEEMKRISRLCEVGTIKLFRDYRGKSTDEKIWNGITVYSHDFMRPMAQRAGVWDEVRALGFDEPAELTRKAWPTLNTSYTSSSRLAAADDRRHRLRASALSRESLIFLLFIPEERIGAIAYTWVDGESKAGAMALVFERENEKIVHAHVEGVPVSPDRDFDDWEVGFLRLQHGEPHREAHVSFAVDNVSLDYSWLSTTPAFSYLDNRDGCPAFLADNRFEQSGRVSGVLTVGDRVIPFDTTGHRDHSWGTRDWTAIHHYRWINIQGDGIAINFMHLDAIDQPTLHGYVDLNGKQAGIVGARFKIDRDSDLFVYTSAELELEDEFGRTTVVRSGPRDVAITWPAGGLASHDAASYCTVNGQRALMHVEEGWPPEFVQRRRAMAHAEEDTPEVRAALAVNRAVGVKE